MTARDPRIDPQPGDELRDGANVRCVLQREGDVLWCLVGLVRYQTSLARWQQWCEHTGAEVLTGQDRVVDGLDLGRQAAEEPEMRFSAARFEKARNGIRRVLRYLSKQIGIGEKLTRNTG